MTKKLYFTSRNLTLDTHITHIGVATRAVALSETLIHPQGGGQRSDTGTLIAASGARIRIERADKSEDGDVLHTLASVEGLAEGDSVTVIVDEQPRRFHERLHTAGHVLAQVAERIFPRMHATKGHHWPTESYVEFALDGAPPGEGFQHDIQAQIEELLASSVDVQFTDGADSPRLVTIRGFPGLPCGGTHVSLLSEVGAIVIRNIKVKRSTIKIGYDIAPL